MTGPLIAAAAAVSWLLAARILHYRWHRRLGRRGPCGCERGTACQQCELAPATITVLAAAGALIWPILLALWAVQAGQPATASQRARMLQAEQRRVNAETDRLTRARAALRAARDAWTREAETDLGMGEHD